MSVKIRLQRHGKKGKPFYWVVAADARSKRDGRYLEKIGTYNPNTNPATLKIDVDSAVNWLQNGAQPTDTARNLLSEVGAMLKNHLVNGVHKGALKKEDVEMIEIDQEIIGGTKKKKTFKKLTTVEKQCASFR